MLRRPSFFGCLIMFFAIRSNYLVCSLPSDPVFILGFAILNEESLKHVFFSVDQHLYIPEGDPVKIRLFGRFTANTYFKFSTSMDCKGSSGEKKLHLFGSDDTTADVDVTLPKGGSNGDYTSVYFCLRESTSTTSTLQGGYLTPNGKKLVRGWLTLKLINKDRFTFAFRILAIIILLMLSSLFSGLNLGLLSLDKTDLKVIINTGSQKERTEALKIVSVRNHGNFLLCSLLFSNVLVNTVLTLVMDSVFGGDWRTVVITTLAIVIIGEILPQAVCSRYGLTVGAKTIYITKFFMTITFPVAYPVGKLLDKLLGEEVGAVYTRDRLKELLKVTRDQHGLESEEMGIISGTLDMKTKTVKEVMTPLDNMFMVSQDAYLNVDLLAHIEDSGFTRIPVYQDDRWNVVGLLNVKNLTLYDPGQNLQVKHQIDHTKSHLFFVFENTRLDYMLKAFREGNRGHMAFVQRINDEGPGDPKYETIGLLTLEDVLEELLQAEIYDENDVEKLQAKSQNKVVSLPIANYAKAKMSTLSVTTTKR